MNIFTVSFPDVFAYQHGQAVEVWLQTVFSGDHQGQLDRCVVQVDMLRRVLLGKGVTFQGRPGSKHLATSLCCPNLFAYRRAGMPGLMQGLLCWRDIIAVTYAALSMALCPSGMVLAMNWLLSRVGGLGAGSIHAYE
jgi:hypothetical protein